jgi:hypothetical protein
MGQGGSHGMRQGGSHMDRRLWLPALAGRLWLSLYMQGARALLLCLCSAMPAWAAGEYRVVETEGLKIIVDSEWAPRSAPGYLPVRFDITNLTETRVIEIVGQGSRFFVGRRGGGGRPGSIEILQSVRLARGDRVRFTLPLPVMADSENVQFQIREDGRTLERLNYVGFQSRANSADASALIVAEPSSGFAATAASWRRVITGRTGVTMRGGPGSVPTPHLDFVLEPARLPANWLGYTSLRAVLIGAKEWDQLTGNQRSALLTWAACGGDLMVVDGNFDTVFPIVPGAAMSPGFSVRAYFFGRIHVPTSASISNAGLASVLADAAKVQDLNWGLPANRTPDWGAIKARGFRLPIPGVAGIPARAYLSILVVFAIIIGPINYWFLRRRRQQVLLVLTTPLISALFIVLLAGYVMAGEGLGVRGRAVTFTMLDQARRQSATRTSASLYAAGMTPGGGLRFARDVAVFAIGPEGSGSRDRYTLDLTEAQRFSSGVIQARSPANIEQIAFRPARERVTFTPEGSGWSAMNGLDATITALVYRRGNTAYTLTGPLAAGGKGVLTLDKGAAAALVPGELPLSSRFSHLFAHQPDGSYLAILDRSPFWDPGVSTIDERGSFHLVIGWPAGQP